MSAIDKITLSNAKFALGYDPSTVSSRPRMALAVLTCMDTRISATTLGLEPQDAHFIRNAGGLATQDAIRSLLISHYLLGTKEVMVINHTDCGLAKGTDDDIREVINRRTGMQLDPEVKFHTFQDVEANVRSQLKILDAQIWMPDEMTIRGFVFDVQTAHLREIFRP